MKHGSDGAWFFLLGLCLACFLPAMFSAGQAVAAVAQSAGYTLQNQSLAVSGSGASAGYALSGLAGEPGGVAEVSSASYRLEPGFPIRTDYKRGTVQFNAATYTVNEYQGTVTITVTRAGGSDGAASVQYATSDGTAVAGTDYTSASGTLNWTDGDGASKTFSVTVTNDALVDGDRTVNLTLSGATGASLGGASPRPC